MKKSKVWRKELNQLRNMGEVPWPARRFRYPPTFGGRAVIGRCRRPVGMLHSERGRLRKRRSTRTVLCGGELVLVPFKGIRCDACRARRRQARALQRMRQARRFRAVPVGRPREQQPRFAARVLQRFRRGER